MDIYEMNCSTGDGNIPINDQAMKTICNMLLIVILLVCMPSCNDNGADDPIPVPLIESQRIQFVASVDESEELLEISDGFSFDLHGNASSCNLTDAGCFEIWASISEVDQAGKFQLRDGTLVLSSETSSCELIGQFEGEGSVANREFSFNTELEVNHGSGIYSSRACKLNLILQGTLPTESDPYLSYQVVIDGFLKGHL